MFERCFPENQLEKWDCNSSTTGLSIYAGNRIFTPARETDSGLEVAMPDAWDPSKRLRGLIGGELVFTTENIVLFYERTRSFQ